MLSPSSIESLSAELIFLYQSMESDLIRNVARHLIVSDVVMPSESDAWRLKKLNQLGALRSSNIKIIAQYTKKSVPMIEKILTSAGYQCIAADERLYEFAYVEGALTTIPVPFKSSSSIQTIIANAVSSVKGNMNLVNTTALESSQKVFISAVNQAYLETSLGVTSYDTAAKKAVRRLADQGISGATYISATGKIINTQMDVAMRRNIISASAKATGEIQIKRAEEWGSNLVEVTSHQGSRPDHAVWQGKIYSLKGSTPKYPNLAISTGYGSVTGLKGANCKHDFYPFFEGISEQTYHQYDKTLNDQIYEKSQQQRKLEREIRQQKRRIVAGDAAKDTQGVQKAQLQLKAKEKQLKSFLDTTGRTARTNRTQVLGFDQSKAAKAVQAAKRNIR